MQMQPKPEPMRIDQPGGGATVGCVSNLQRTLLGIVLIVCGVLSIIFNIVDIAVTFKQRDVDYKDDKKKTALRGFNIFHTTGFVGHGFWSGVMCIVTGTYAIVTSRSGTKLAIFSYIILMIVCATLAFLQFAIAVIGAWQGSYYYEFDIDYYDNYYDRYNEDSDTSERVKALIAMESLLAIFGLIGGVTAVVGSAVGCRTAGCCTGYYDRV